MSDGDQAPVVSTDAVPEQEQENPSSPKGTKRPAPDSTDPSVHSANDWEHANLGDTERKSKFLRLMGASKKDHYGKFVIGEQSRSKERTAESSSQRQHGLEEQFEAGMEHKRVSGFRGHKGLGFHVEEAPKESTEGEAVSSTETPAADTEKSPDETEQATAAPAEASNTDQEEKSPENGRESIDTQSAPDSSSSPPPVPEKYAKLGFVKSSS